MTNLPIRAFAFALAWRSLVVVADPPNAQPVVSDPGDFIVGDYEKGESNNVFVFPDAIDLRTIVTDDLTPGASIKWSYSSAGRRYLINGVAEIDPHRGESPNQPGPKNLNGQDHDVGHPGQDSNSLTITIRDNRLSPVGQSPPFPEPGSGRDRRERRGDLLRVGLLQLHSPIGDHL